MTPAAINRVLRDVYADQSKQQKKRYGDPPGICIGVDFGDLDRQMRSDDAQRTALLETGRGCGETFLLGWAGNSPVRCGALLHELNGTITVLKCDSCKES